ncbi:MAG: InlB B-repeat-containing protein, partial [Clostridia bacterium]|nr:InlB B-repeat-containing protein [Clostridia bacterium]
MLKKRKSIKYLIMSIALLLCITIAIMSGAPSFDSVGSTPTTPMADATLNATYGALFNGSTYRYTDYTKVEDMHSGAITDDTTVVTVDSAKPHGSQENPFVIDSISKWTAFAADMNNTSSGITNYGAGSYFVLAKDLDFSSSTFTPVNHFDGTLYGLGHSLDNISYNFNYSSESAIFLNLEGDVIIADLNAKNIYFNNVGANNGILCAIGKGNINILNCHLEGTVLQANSVSSVVEYGAIIGVLYAGTDILVYRSSANSNATLKTTTREGAVGGSIVGDSYDDASVTILDCYGKLYLDFSSSYNDVYTGILGRSCNNKGEIRVEGSVNYIYQDNMETIAHDHPSSLFSFWVSSVRPSNITVKDTYTSGRARRSGVEYSIYPAINFNEHNSIMSAIPLTVDNFNWYAGSDIWTRKSGDSYSYGYYLNGVSNSKRNTTSEVSLWQSAQTDTDASGNEVLKSSILTNKNQIGDETYYLDYSPVINKILKEQFDVEFFNYKNNKDEGLAVSTIKYDYGDTSITLSAPTEPDANHKFVGWTTDKSGEGEIFTTLPDNAYGNLKLYAVWDNPNTTASISLYNSNTSDSTNTIEYGTGNIKLKASASGTGMTNPTKTFKWYKDSESTAVESGDTCTLTDVKHSGTYSLEYTLQDTEEPLWRHKEKLTTTQSVTINKGQLNLDKFEIDAATPAYFGIELSQVKFSAQVKDNGENVVSGSARWEMPSSDVKDGVNSSYNIVFTPTDGDNYAEATLPVTFDSDYVTLTFDMKISINREIVVNLEYGQDYDSIKIVNMFLEEFRKRIVAPTDPTYDPDIHIFDANFKNVEDRTPTFDNVDITAYNQQLLNVTSPKTITVAFINKDYTVTFD